MEHYRESLTHIIRPEQNRQDASRIRLDDWEALYLYDPLVEYAAYSAPDAEHETVALGLAEYLDNTVREEGKDHVYVYHHTGVAETVLSAISDAMVDTAERMNGGEDE